MIAPLASARRSRLSSTASGSPPAGGPSCRAARKRSIRSGAGGPGGARGGPADLAGAVAALDAALVDGAVAPRAQAIARGRARRCRWLHRGRTRSAPVRSCSAGPCRRTTGSSPAPSHVYFFCSRAPLSRRGSRRAGAWPGGRLVDDPSSLPPPQPAASTAVASIRGRSELVAQRALQSLAGPGRHAAQSHATDRGERRVRVGDEPPLFR